MLRTTARQQCRSKLRPHACQRHQEVPESKYDPKHKELWTKVELPGGADEFHVCVKAKALNFLMPMKTLTREPHKG